MNLCQLSYRNHINDRCIKYLIGVIQGEPGTSVLEPIDIFYNYYIDIAQMHCITPIWYIYDIYDIYIYVIQGSNWYVFWMGKNWAKSTNKGSVNPTSGIKWILSIIKLNYSQLDGSAEQYSARLSQFRAKLSILSARHRESHTRWTTETKRRILPNIKC